MSFQYTGAYMVPGQTSESLTFENTFWVDRYERQIWESVLLSGATRDAGNTTTTVLRSGLLLGKITATNKLVEWSPTAIDGSQFIFGILSMGVNAQRVGANQDRWLGQVMVGGALKASKVLIPGQASVGISGNAYEHLIRAQLQGRFLFDDKWEPNSIGFRNIQEHTADYTVTEGENNTLFTNRGDAGAIIFTLPTSPDKGLRYAFYTAAAQTLTITSGTADTLIVQGDLTADTLTLPAVVGQMVEVFGDGTGWLTRMSVPSAALTAAVPATLTVVDGVGTNNASIAAITADASVIAAVQELAAAINAIIAVLPTATKAT